MIDTPRPVEDAVLEKLRDGVYDEADELIERCGLDWAEMYTRASVPALAGVLVDLDREVSRNHPRRKL